MSGDETFLNACTHWSSTIFATTITTATSSNGTNTTAGTICVITTVLLQIAHCCPIAPIFR